MKQLKCPKCKESLEPVVYANIEVDRCTNCKGLWFDSLELEELKQIKGAESIDIGAPEVGSKFNKIGNINCPICGTKMTKMVDLKQSHIWYEKCPVCYGAWFDAGEFKDLKEEKLIEVLRDLFIPARE